MTQRVDYVTRQLLAGRSGPQIVAETSLSWGISRRQARRIVAKAYEVVVADLEESGIDRTHLTAQVIANLQEGVAKALAGGHISAMVGCCRELRELVGLGSNTSHHHSSGM